MAPWWSSSALCPLMLQLFIGRRQGPRVPCVSRGALGGPSRMLNGRCPLEQISLCVRIPSDFLVEGCMGWHASEMGCEVWLPLGSETDDGASWPAACPSTPVGHQSSCRPSQCHIPLPSSVPRRPGQAQFALRDTPFVQPLHARAQQPPWAWLLEQPFMERWRWPSSAPSSVSGTAAPPMEPLPPQPRCHTSPCPAALLSALVQPSEPWEPSSASASTMRDATGWCVAAVAAGRHW